MKFYSPFLPDSPLLCVLWIIFVVCCLGILLFGRSSKFDCEA